MSSVYQKLAGILRKILQAPRNELVVQSLTAIEQSDLKNVLMGQFEGAWLRNVVAVPGGAPPLKIAPGPVHELELPLGADEVSEKTLIAGDLLRYLKQRSLSCGGKGFALTPDQLPPPICNDSIAKQIASDLLEKLSAANPNAVVFHKPRGRHTPIFDRCDISPSIQSVDIHDIAGGVAPGMITAGSVNVSFQGPNARMNVASVDNSTNVVNQSQADVIQNLRVLIDSQIKDESVKQELHQSVEMCEKAGDQASRNKAYERFMAAAATHMSVFSPVIPTLVKFLGL